MRIAITGAAGFIGTALAGALRRRFSSAYLLGLDPRGPRLDSPLDTQVHWEMRMPLAPFLRRQRIDHLIHLAFVVDPIRSERRMARVNVAGSRHVLREAVAAGVEQITLLSSATAYGVRKGSAEVTLAPYAESAPLLGLRAFSYPRHKALVEAEVATLRGAHPEVRFFLPRPPAVIGPGMRNYLRRQLQQSVMVVPAGAEAPFQVVDVDDLAEVLALGVERRLDGPLNVAAPGVLTMSRVAELAGARLRRVPPRLLRGAAALFWGLGIRSVAPAPAGILDYVQFPWLIDTGRLEMELQPRWQHDAEGAMRRTLRGE
jgi:UDP-glucose 4-epimerase